ncbi:MAG: 5-oxoprolinase subunit PxpB [Pyrinomonadaceae bacterium]
MNESFEIISLGESALIVTFGNVIDEKINQRVNSLCFALESKPFSGFIEAVPAYSSLTVYYDNLLVTQNFRHSLTAFEVAKNLIEIEMEKLPITNSKEGNLIEIAVNFDTEAALDLARISEEAELPEQEVIEIFLSQEYRVYMLGFLPGFAYMGTVDERIACPRKRTPRTRVPKGSVGIAGMQTGIYPIESPGGWQIIGRTDQELFDVLEAEIETLSPGDRVKFIAK